MDDRLVLVGATVIDGTGAPPEAGRGVVVAGDRIAEVVPAARVPVGAVFRLDGLTLLPGLINCHVHLRLGAEADPVRVLLDDPLGLTALKAALRARQTVEAGVTTVRDLGGRDYVTVTALAHANNREAKRQQRRRRDEVRRMGHEGSETTNSAGNG